MALPLRKRPAQFALRILTGHFLSGTAVMHAKLSLLGVVALRTDTRVVDTVLSILYLD